MRFLKVRRLVNRLHLYLGLTATIPLVLLGLTGAPLVFQPELDRALAPDLWYVEPGSARLGWQDLVDAIREARPDRQLVGLELPPRPDLACVFVLRERGAAADADAIEVHVDPYTGRVLGERSPRSTPVGFLLALHTSFFLTWGGYIGGTASAVLLALLASGLVLWWPTGKDKRAGLRVRLGRPWRTIGYDVHRAGGFYAGAILATIALTGCVFTFHAIAHPLIRALTLSKATPRTAKAEPIAGVPDLPLDEILARGDAAMPGTFATIVSFPREVGDPIRLIRRKPTHEPRDYGRSFLWLHPQTGEVLLENSFRNRSLGDAVISWNRHMHVGAWGLYFGDRLGMMTKVVWLVVSLAPVLLAASGVLIWWKPRARKTAARPEPPARAPKVAAASEA